MVTRSHPLAIGARPALAGLAALALAAAACSSATSSPSPGSASLPAFSAHPSSPTSSQSAAASSLATLSASASPGASPTGALAECTTLASGLLNPRGVTVADDGTIYVAEAGTGGTEPDFATAPVGSPSASLPAESLPALGSPAATMAETSPGASGSPAPVTSHGESGQVTKITTDGTQSVLVSGLTSYNFMGEVVGPAGVVVGKDGTIYVSIGGPGPGTSQFEPAGNADSVVKVDSTGTVTTLANIGQYERENNPDPNAVDSNVGGMAMGADGLLYVADSGGNDLYSVNPETGELKLVAVIPGLPSVNGAPNPARGNKPEVDPVPTSVAADPKGGVFVGLLTGAALWGSPGSAEVIHVGIDGKIDDAVKGLNMVTGVAQKDDSIYASELSTNFTATPPEPGQLSSAAVGGTPETVFTGLPLPYGIAVAADGKSIDIVINSTGEPGTTPNGSVINCPLPAAPVASPKATETAPASASPLVTMPAESASPAESVAPTTPAESASPAESGQPSASPAT